MQTLEDAKRDLTEARIIAEQATSVEELRPAILALVRVALSETNAKLGDFA